MTPHYADDTVTVYAGDCLDVLAELPDASVDAVCTDPPYGLEFMGKEWDGANGFRRSLNPADTGRDSVFGRTSRTSPEYRALHTFQQWCEQWATECFRILKPGGHLLAFGGTRTWHRLTCAIEDAGFEIRDSIAWLYGSGFPKSLDVSKAIDRAAGAEREVIGRTVTPYRVDAAAERGTSLQGSVNGDFSKQTEGGYRYTEHTAPATNDARRWQGWGTALKPAHEPIVVARKPLSGTVAANVLQHGTGALNVDATRIAHRDAADLATSQAKNPGRSDSVTSGVYGADRPQQSVNAAGRWPSNVVLDEHQAAALDQQSGESKSPPVGSVARTQGGQTIGTFAHQGRPPSPNGHGDSGGASRFFYTAKADIGERVTVPKADAKQDTYGTRKRCVKCGKQEVNSRPTSMCSCPEPDFQPDPSQSGYVSHPTVKPLDLMRWLVRLVTPPGGTVLDPFAGSGTTAEACILERFRCIAIEREPDYLPLITQRINRRRDPAAYVKASGEDGGLFDLLDGEGT